MGRRPRGDAQGRERARAVTVLVDTSALVEFLRATGSAAATRVRALADLSDQLAVTDVVAMEILAGARDERHLAQLEEFLAGFAYLQTRCPDDFEVAATLYRTCRRQGRTIRQLTDCLVAATAIRNGVALLHADGDFELLARHTALQIA
jgi:predicted nucleic acid-binding protein